MLGASGGEHTAREAAEVEVNPPWLVPFFEQQIPFNAWLGLRVTHVGTDRCSVVVPFRPELVGDPLRPALHGGVLSTVIDATGGLAVFAALADPETRASTVDLRVDYLRPARLEDLVCDARVLRMGNRVAVTSMAIHHGDPEQVVAEGRGVYNVVRG